MNPRPSSLVSTFREVCSWETGVDMTGELLLIPPKHVRIPDYMAEQYEAKGFVLKKDHRIEHDGQIKSVVLIDLESTLQKQEEALQHDRDRRTSHTHLPAHRVRV